MKLVGIALKWLGFGVYAGCAVLIVMFLTPIGGWKALNVLTGSMRPIIQPGALVLIHRVPLSSLKPGDIITYQNPRNFTETITHRVLSVTKVKGIRMVTTKGDANPAADPAFPGGFVVGREALIVPAAGKYINYLHNPFGLAALVVIPGLLVIWAEVRRLRRALRQPMGEETAAPAVAHIAPPPAPVAELAAPQPARPRRNLDGMRRVVGLVVVSVVSLIVGSAYAAVVAKVPLTSNSFAAATAGPTPTPSPSPTTSPCPGTITISNTGPGSVNTVTCTSSNSISTTNSNTVIITTLSGQSSASGSASGGSSGGASNSSATTVGVSVSNF